MDETRLALQLSRESAFNADGVATVEFRNGGLTRWKVESYSITTTSTTQTECAIYRGAVHPTNQLDITDTGNNNSGSLEWMIPPGDYLTVQWTRGTTGAIASMRIEGTDIARGRRSY